MARTRKTTPRKEHQLPVRFSDDVYVADFRGVVSHAIKNKLDMLRIKLQKP